MKKKIVRTVDFARRLTLPKDLTDKLEIKPNDSVELNFSNKNQCIIIRQHIKDYKD